MQILITAGGTREYVDPVRFISNASSGRMGLALTRAAITAGHKVTLILANSKLEIRNPKLKVVEVVTAAEMFQAVKKLFARSDCLIMAAAIADYTPVRSAKNKLKKGNKNLTIKLKPTTDILKWAGKHKQVKSEKAKGKKQIVVGFALEDKNLKVNAEKKFVEKNLDMIIANTTAAIGRDKATVHIKTRDSQWLQLSNANKSDIAKKIISLIKK